MSCSMVRSLLQGIQRYKSMPRSRVIHGFNNVNVIRFIRMAHSTTQTSLFANTDERSAMMALWPDVVKDLTEGGLSVEIPEATKRIAEVLHYNVPGGKMHRALTIVSSYRMLARPEQLTDENLKLVRILAWCQEINQAALLMQDDLVDFAQTRRGQLCWHRRDDIGITAVNDSVLLEQASYQLLKTYFNKHECYLNLFQMLTEMTLHVILGQLVDIVTSNRGNEPNVNFFTMDRCNLTTKYRGSFYAFLMPVKLAMCLAGITDPEMYRQVEPILRDLGHLYVIQNDYLDSYGDANATTHIGTDIKLGKGSWLVVTALEHATPTQRMILQECYGYEDPEKVARVKQMYDELDLPTIYANYEEKAYNSIKTRIKQITCDFPKDLLDALLAMMYRRTI